MESYVNGLKSGTIAVDQFGGLNLTPSCTFSEFERMENAKTDDFPVLSTRNSRKKLSFEISDVNGVWKHYSRFTKYTNREGVNASEIYLLSPGRSASICETRSQTVYLTNGSTMLQARGLIVTLYGRYETDYEGVKLEFDTAEEHRKVKAILGLTEVHKNDPSYEMSDVPGGTSWEAWVFNSKLQSNVAYLDGYFYYVRDTRLCRRMAITNAVEEKIEIGNVNIYKNQTIRISGRKVVVTPCFLIYDVDKDLAYGKAGAVSVAYDDIDICCTSTSKDGGEFKIVIKGDLGVYLGKRAEYTTGDIEYVFTTKSGTKYTMSGIWDGTDDKGRIITMIIPYKKPSGSLPDDQKAFVTNCISMENNYNRNIYGELVAYKLSLKEDLFSTKGSVLTLVGLDSDLDFNPKFITPYNNRNFACNVEGDCVYSSVIGSLYDFNALEDGEASADWISVMSSGVFTGMTAFGGNVFYFKEHCVHKLYGSSPSDWQLVELPINGVENGAENSIAVENDYCIYKSTDGFYIFDGLTATKISDKLGRYMDIGGARYSSAIFKGKYYCAVVNFIGGTYTLFTYDISKGLWSCEECDTELGTTADVQIMKTQRDVYLVKCNASTAEIISLNSNREFEFDSTWTDSMPWCVQTGRLDVSSPYNKHFTKIAICAEGDGSAVTVKAIGKGASRERSFTFSPTEIDTFTYAFKPMRCDNMKLKLSGTGQAKIHSITVFLSEGSEIR